MENITYISHQSYLFKGTVRENLWMGLGESEYSNETMRSAGAGREMESLHDGNMKSPGAYRSPLPAEKKKSLNDNASVIGGTVRRKLTDDIQEDAVLWKVLEQVNLAEFLRSEDGLDTCLTEQGANLSGGQRQRLALARALLHDSPIYIFDEATSNIDVESENDIMAQIHELAKEKTVILISHRLANVVDSDRIYVMDAGTVAECGTHEELLQKGGRYAELWNTQQKLENYGKEA